MKNVPFVNSIFCVGWISVTITCAKGLYNNNCTEYYCQVVV